MTMAENRRIRGIESSVMLTPVKENSLEADLQFARALGFNPDIMEDLPDFTPPADLPPVAKPPGWNSVKEPMPPEDVSTKEIRKEFPKPDPSKVLTNISEDTMPAKFYVNRVGKFPYHEESVDCDASGERLDNVSGILPYLGQEAFANGIYVREPTMKDAAAISRAVNGQSTSAMFDALAKTVNVPYRRLTVEDHIQVMYYHLMNSYPAQRIPVTWDSQLYGIESHNKAYKFNITETVFAMDAEGFKYFQDKGFTLPRVYDIENVETLENVPDGIFLLDVAQYLDPYHPLLAPYVKKASEAKSPYPRLQGRIDFLADKPVRFKYEVEEFKKAIGDFGVTETLPLAADAKKMTIGSALQYLDNLPAHTKEQATEYKRLQTLAKPSAEETVKINRMLDLEKVREDATLTAEQEEEYKALEADPPNPFAKSFTPIEEGVSLVRDLWRFFPFV
jgi:hypothetical protein